MLRDKYAAMEYSSPSRVNGSDPVERPNIETRLENLYETVEATLRFFDEVTSSPVQEPDSGKQQTRPFGVSALLSIIEALSQRNLESAQYIQRRIGHL